MLNCASGGIARLPVSEMEEWGIRYAYTNCKQDSHTYPILHDKVRRETPAPRSDDKSQNVISGLEDIVYMEERMVCSKHLEVSNALFVDVRRRNAEAAAASASSQENGKAALGGQQLRGRVMFFCVAGQNRSAVLAMATMLIHGVSLETILRKCAKQRPFVLENVGFQRQLVELEAILELLTKDMGRGGGGGGGLTYDARDRFASHWDLVRCAARVSTESRFPSKRVRMMVDRENEIDKYDNGMSRSPPLRSPSEYEVALGTKAEIELLIPGLCTMEVRIPRECTIPALKHCLVQHVNNNLLCHEKCPSKVAKAWLIQIVGCRILITFYILPFISRNVRTIGPPPPTQCSFKCIQP